MASRTSSCGGGAVDSGSAAKHANGSSGRVLARGAASMHAVYQRGFAIDVQHPAVWVDRGQQIVRDLIDLFAHPDITPRCLRHLIANRWRLIGGHYEEQTG